LKLLLMQSENTHRNKDAASNCSKSFIEKLVCFLMLTLDQMGTRINDLERNVTELMTQAGMEALIKQQHGAFIKALLITS
uniref:Uncharacterized protein n=1 Tax=Haplochromis burtoni TaxID=8153 RepID=A0A3Q2VXL4_HAPBU